MLFSQHYLYLATEEEVTTTSVLIRGGLFYTVAFYGSEVQRRHYQFLGDDFIKQPLASMMKIVYFWRLLVLLTSFLSWALLSCVGMYARSFVFHCLLIFTSLAFVLFRIQLHPYQIKLIHLKILELSAEAFFSLSLIFS